MHFLAKDGPSAGIQPVVQVVFLLFVCFLSVCIDALASLSQSARQSTVLVHWLGNNSHTFNGHSANVLTESIATVNGKKTAATNVKLLVGDVLELTFPLTVGKAVVIENGGDGTGMRAQETCTHP